MGEITKYPTTAEDLALRDLQKSELNLERAKNKKNVTKSEIERCEELVRLRKEIYARLLFKEHI